MNAAAHRRGTRADFILGRLNATTELPLATVLRLRPHAARRSTTVPLLAIEIVEAAFDQRCVEELVADRAPPASADGAAARFDLNIHIGRQLRLIAVRFGMGVDLFGRAIVEAALDGGHVDRLLVGRFDRGEPRQVRRTGAPGAIAGATP